MRQRLLALAAVLALATLASSAPRAEASIPSFYCNPSLCADQDPAVSCACPPGTDKEGSPSNCEVYNGVGKGGCWYE